MAKRTKTNDGGATVMDIVDTTTLEALNEIAGSTEPIEPIETAVEVTVAQDTVLSVTGRQPVHAGPFTPMRINDLISSGNASRENITDEAFVEGIKVLILADVHNDVTLEVLGSYYNRVLEIASTDKEAFEDILCSLTEQPMLPEHQEPDPTDKDKMVTVKPTALQRLAHAVYIDTKPDLLTTMLGNGNASLGYKRIQNACDRARKLSREQEQARVDKRTTQDKLLFPAPQDTEHGAIEAKKIADAEAKQKADNAAVRKMLPRTAQTIFLALYKAAREDSIERTGETRRMIDGLFSKVGFTMEVRQKWHSEYMKGAAEADKMWRDDLNKANEDATK